MRVLGEYAGLWPYGGGKCHVVFTLGENSALAVSLTLVAYKN